ncbi:VOC family protein [Tateyamaria sp. SN3-11]|uniref:VOC family protein n=1 Tax=Tateyamaria sp. SN3-11 TaxID=3092147 RepID=UPI0039EACB3F
MTHSKVGQINWHDLFTSNRDSSMEFYGHVANWTYQVERATDFVWGCGKKNFILTLSGDEAGARLAETPSSQENGWIAYVEVPDVDAVVKRVDRLGGKIIRKPFEVPGVGRNALVLDLLAALFELSLSRHSFPVPRRQFGPEVYVSNGNELLQAFYTELFGWQVYSQDKHGLLAPSGEPVAVEQAATWPAGSNAAWVPSVKVASVFDARRLAETNGARPTFVHVDEMVQSYSGIICDPDGAPFTLDVEQTNSF